MINQDGLSGFRESLEVIPGGTQLFSKRPELFSPTNWPTYYSKANGISVTALDGKKYLDMSNMGVGSCILGYADKDVNKAIIKILKKGIQSTLIAEEEMQLANVLLNIHPWAQMVRYARSGGEAVSLAIRIARVATGKDVVLFSGYHGWNDWYLAANLGDSDNLEKVLLPGLSARGVPQGLKGSAVPFGFNELEQFKNAAEKNSGKVAAVVMEPRRSEIAQPGFLEFIREYCSKNGIVLIFDEITTGWRMHEGGIHLSGSVLPDLAVFAKAFANGHAMSAVIGKSEVMKFASESFISSTNWTERVGLVAAIATIKKYKQENVGIHISNIGEKVTAGWLEIAKNSALEIEAENGGLASLSHFTFLYPESRGMNIFFCNRMLELGWLAHNQLKPSLAHTTSHVSRYLDDVSVVFMEISKLIESENKIFKELSTKFPAPSIPRLTK
jgi:glutamate-1-semialdehyde aminotransferase